VRWEPDPKLPSGIPVPDPSVVVELASEFLRIEERFMTKKYEWVFLNLCIPKTMDGSDIYLCGLDGLAMHNHKTDQTLPCRGWRFVLGGRLHSSPEDAAEGDGWVVSLVQGRAAGRCDVVLIDMTEFEKLVVIVQLPFHVKSQIHGNWVPGTRRRGQKALVREMGEVKVSGKGSLEPF
jgi:carotenoid cleavage dioxygenase-like enzyme